MDNVNKLKQIINDIAITKQQEIEKMEFMMNNDLSLLPNKTFTIVRMIGLTHNKYVERSINTSDIAKAFKTLLLNHHMLEFNHFLTENEINQFITEGGKEIEALYQVTK